MCWFPSLFWFIPRIAKAQSQCCRNNNHNTLCLILRCIWIMYFNLDNYTPVWSSSPHLTDGEIVASSPKVDKLIDLWSFDSKSCRLTPRLDTLCCVPASPCSSPSPTADHPLNSADLNLHLLLGDLSAFSSWFRFHRWRDDRGDYLPVPQLGMGKP